MKHISSLLLGLSLTLSGGVNAEQKLIDKPSEETINQAQQAFLNDLRERPNIDVEAVQQWLAKAKFNDDVFAAIQRPWEAKPWHQYRPIFLTEKRVTAGRKFWQEHADTLAKAEDTYGVPAEIIVAIIGVETFYGEYKGKYSVLDSLYTLAFYYPPRAKFFSTELAEYFELANEEGFTPDHLMGSYAGAMGLGQFISSSYRHYAVDFDGDGVRDLFNNPTDAIGSVANYFAKHQWQAGEPVAVELPRHPDNATLVSDGMKPEQKTSTLLAEGLQSDTELSPERRAKVFAFEQVEHQDYWLGFDNFYVITRYNHSPLYAMAVYQLSQEIRQAYEMESES